MTNSVQSIPTFDSAQESAVERLLAAKVSRMMGRKLEEEDWTSVYCAAKGIPPQGWSNLNLDVMHENLGIEHKMLCYRKPGSLLDACGKTLMHPSATRALRLTSLDTDPNDEMRNIFQQYSDLLLARREKVAMANGVHLGEVELRTGWLLWQESLREFLYFEEETAPPNPDNYYAEWNERRDGKRRGSKNLWVYDAESGQKRFSLTTSAGIKLQPYFDVPLEGSDGLYHWTVIGESVSPIETRMWLLAETAEALSEYAGSAKSAGLSRFLLDVCESMDDDAGQFSPLDEAEVQSVEISTAAYEILNSKFPSINDQQLCSLLLNYLALTE